MARARSHRGRHRLGAPGLVHCVVHYHVADALQRHRRGWWTALFTPARHSLAGMRKRAGTAALDSAWAPPVGDSAPAIG
ncbi:MAG: hypothetical protein J2O49_03410 [Sciscionella sp.]|nr:hypothetical protein [Sciscionella sp.]